MTEQERNRRFQADIRENKRKRYDVEDIGIVGGNHFAILTFAVDPFQIWMQKVGETRHPWFESGAGRSTARVTRLPDGDAIRSVAP